MHHFIVNLAFKAPFDTFGDAVQRHRAFLQEGYDQELILCSGPLESRIGGIVVAKAESQEALRAFFSRDPYLLEGLAEHTYQAFTPAKRQPFLEAWVTEA